MMASKKTKLPIFCRDREERQFWGRHSVEEFAQELEEFNVVLRSPGFTTAFFR